MYKDFISKFSKLVENVTARSSNAGFLIGDQVKFTKKAAKSPWFNNMNEIYLRDLAEFMACEVPMRIAAIRSDSTPAAFGFATGQDNVGAERFADVYMEIAPGRQGRIITVPCSVLEVVDNGANISSYIDKWRRENKITIKPEEVKSTDANKTNPKNNTQIPAASAKSAKVKTPAKSAK